MIGTFFRRSLSQRPGAHARQAHARDHLSLGTMPAAVYAIGDVHGCLDLLKDMDARIAEDGEAFPGPKLIVLLGDMIDRGTRSAAVLDYLMEPPAAGYERICLCGNHEIMFEAFLASPKVQDPWLSYGGRETLASYGIYVDPGDRDRDLALRVASAVPESHRDFVRSRPLSLRLPGYTLVHAGLSPDQPVEAQPEEALLWMHWAEDDNGPATGPKVVHGHIAARDIEMRSGRINVDIGAYATGRLGAVRLSGSDKPAPIVVGSPQSARGR